MNPEKGDRWVWNRINESFHEMVLRLFQLEILAPGARPRVSAVCFNADSRSWMCKYAYVRGVMDFLGRPKRRNSIGLIQAL